MNQAEIATANALLKSAVTRPVAKRKILQRKIHVNLRETGLIEARTIDVARDGLSMIAPLQIQIGAKCEIEFDLMLNGEKRKVHAVSKVTSSVCVGLTGFRTTLDFLDIDQSSHKAIIDWINYL